MRFLGVVFIPISLITFLGLSQAKGSLIPRARFDGEGRPAVGPPNGPVVCDGIYGNPEPDHCHYATEWLEGVANEEDPTREQEAWDAVHRVLNTIVEFLNPTAERQDRQPRRPAVRTPKYWRYGECVVSVTVLEGGRHQPSDDAAWRDIGVSSNEIQNDCLYNAQQGIYSGGAQLIGEHNDIVVRVFAADSQYGETVEVNEGHEIPTFPEVVQGPIQPDYIDDSDDDDDGDEDVLCFGGEGAGWSLDSKSCCSDTKFVLRKLQNLPVLLGLEALSAISLAIGTCSPI